MACNAECCGGVGPVAIADGGQEACLGALHLLWVLAY